MFLYQIKSRGDDTCSLTTTVREQIENTWLCIKCKIPKEGIKSVDIKIDSILKKPVYYVLGAGISLIRNDLITAIGVEFVNNCCYLGMVYKENNLINKQYSTIRGKYGICIRGNNESVLRKCEKCNSANYFAHGDKYIVDIPADVPILGCFHSLKIYVDESIYQKLLPLNINQLQMEKIPVLDAPCDNYPDFRGYVTR